MPGASRAEREARAVATAAAFLTIVPIGRAIAAGGADLGRAAPSFPLVGAAIGAAVAGTLTGLADVSPPLVAACGALALGTVLTGAMHLDALADTADALGGGSRERALEIMRDPATGSYGTAAVTICLIGEAGALAELGGSGETARVIAAFAIARAVGPALAALLPYAREGTGLAEPLAGRQRARAAAGVAVAVVLAVTVSSEAAAWLCAGAVAVAASAYAGSRWLLGGVTGDTLGAAIALTQVTCLALAASVA
jgi:adenosylcobinamide-GDP ribazoletransferase